MSPRTGTETLSLPTYAHRHHLDFADKGETGDSASAWETLRTIMRELLRASDDTYLEYLEGELIEFSSIETPEASSTIFYSQTMRMELQTSSAALDQLHRQIIIRIVHFESMVSINANLPRLLTTDTNLNSAAWHAAASYALSFGSTLTPARQNEITAQWHKIQRKIKVRAA